MTCPPSSARNCAANPGNGRNLGPFLDEITAFTLGDRHTIGSMAPRMGEQVLHREPPPHRAGQIQRRLPPTHGASHRAGRIRPADRNGVIPLRAVALDRGLGAAKPQASIQRTFPSGVRMVQNPSPPRAFICG